MSFEDFEQSLVATKPPPWLTPSLLALWYDKKGDWESSHNIAQGIGTQEGSWIHAYLHRKEGDSGNAAYWYRQAGTDYPTNTLADEWRALVAEHL